MMTNARHLLKMMMTAMMMMVVMMMVMTLVRTSSSNNPLHPTIVPATGLRVTLGKILALTTQKGFGGHATV